MSVLLASISAAHRCLHLARAKLLAKIAPSIELGIFALILGCLAWLARRLGRHRRCSIAAPVASVPQRTDDTDSVDAEPAPRPPVKTDIGVARCESATQTDQAELPLDLVPLTESSIVVTPLPVLPSHQPEYTKSDVEDILQCEPVYADTFGGLESRAELLTPDSFCDHFETDSDLSSVSLSTTMATTGPAVPPPPPMPGTSGALVMPHWRDTYRPPIRESAPSKEQIEKQQYAHLPDKLLNTLSKDKKPFTYTPQGISG